MKKIQYHYSHITKQAFVLTLFLYTLLRFLIMMEIIIYRIPEYYSDVNIPLTILLYTVLFAVIICMFFSHRFCCSTYDDTHLTYHNRLLRKSSSLDLSAVKMALFDTKGVKFFTSDHGSTEDRSDFFLPFFRGGIIDALQIDGFYKQMKASPHIRVQKRFKVLPGYTKKWKVLSVVYGFLAVILFMNCATPLTLVIVLFQNH